MAQRIRERIPDAQIVFLVRENLKEGFSLLEGVEAIAAPSWKRGEKIDVQKTLKELGIDPASYDLIVEHPSPTDWVSWQRGKVVPRLKWDPKHDGLWKKFGLSETTTYIGVQVAAETNYGLWRNWPPERWEAFFKRLEAMQDVKALLFGFGSAPRFDSPAVIDLRGKTSLFDMLSIVKNRCSALLLPDSGVLSMAYYLDASFPIRVVSLWADPNHGILKQAVPSPNPQLVHIPLIGEFRDLSTVSVEQVVSSLFPSRPLRACRRAADVERVPVAHAACIVTAGGQGSRLGMKGPKGLFPVAGKSLFEWICQKAVGKGCPLAIMTSPANHEETVAFFKQRSFFGLEIHFFQQETRPLLDERRKKTVALGPNGNGSLFRSFAKSGLEELFAQRGIDTVTVIPVENPLADPFDPALIAFHRNEGADATVKCIERREVDLAMGALVERQGKIEVAEYMEIAPRELKARGDDGSLLYKYANTGQLAFSLPFLRRMAEIDLPLHWVKKKIPLGSRSVWAWKGEHFIFDAFPYAERVRALCFPRETCYAPLKGIEHLESVEKILRGQ